jgi:hypothetical protein
VELTAGSSRSLLRLWRLEGTSVALHIPSVTKSSRCCNLAVAPICLSPLPVCLGFCPISCHKDYCIASYLSLALASLMVSSHCSCLSNFFKCISLIILLPRSKLFNDSLLTTRFNTNFCAWHTKTSGFPFSSYYASSPSVPF